MIAGRRKLIDDRRVLSVSRRSPRLSFIAIRKQVREVSDFAKDLECSDLELVKRPLKKRASSRYN